MSDFLELFAFGVTAGLALAIPVGPMALLLIDTTVRQGLRVGAAGALAMATVDGGYAITVFLAGSAISVLLGSFGLWLSLLGALILLILGVQTIYRAAAAGKAFKQAEAEKQESASAGKTFLKFAGATIVNPPTALYFLAITPSLAGLSSENPVASTAAFATGVFLGSAVWQQSLALAGLAIRSVTTPKVRTWLSLLGGTMIIGLAIILAYRTISAS